MKEVKRVQANFIERIKDIDGGYTTVAAKLGYTQAYLRKILGLKGEYTPRLEILEKVKEAILSVEKEQSERINKLME